ncbi:hypothetical protein EON65_30035 [archaeon]|nr:MAG: hypothetical protein EON65_30035 [archaeon]
MKVLLFGEPGESDQSADATVFQQNEDRILSVLSDISAAAQVSAENQDALGSVECIRFITKVLDSGHSSKAVLHTGLKAWMKLCRRFTLQKNTTSVQNCDISEIHMITLVPLMRKHTDDEVIMLYGCSMVMILASDSDMRQMKFGLIGTSKVVITALEKHIDQPEVAEMALRATRNLSVNDTNANQLCEQQVGIPLVSLLTYPTHPRQVMEATLYAIINLSYNNDNALILGGNDMCFALMRAWEIWKDATPSLNHEFLWCVRNLSTIDSHVEQFATTSIVDLVFNSMRGTVESDVIQTALWAVANLCCNVGMAQKCVDMGLINLMNCVYQIGCDNFPEDVDLGPVSEAICFTLFNIASTLCADIPDHSPEEHEIARAKHASIKEMLAQHGSCLLVSKIFDRYTSREAMTELCARVTYILAEHCVHNKHVLTSHGIVQTLCAATGHHSQIPETVFYVWRALLTVCSQENEEGRIWLGGQSEFLGLLARTLKQHEQVEEVVILGCSLLLLLPSYTGEKRLELLAGQFIDEQGRIVVKEDREEMWKVWGVDSHLL